MKKIDRRQFVTSALTGTALAGLLPLASSPAHAQGSWPSKPIRLVVPYPPGGGTDVVSRLIAEPLSQALGQSVIIDNRGGANGIPGCQFVAAAPADGHTILLVLPGQMAVNPALYKDLPYNPVRDFAPIIQLTSFEVALAVNPSVAARNVNELVALAKSKPRGLTLASAGTGSAGHMAAIWFSMKTGVEWLHVPYKGAGPAFTDLIGGQVDLTFATTLSTLPHVRSGKLRALGVTGAKRSAAAPDIPAIAESIPSYEFTQWHGLVAPARTPPEIVARLNAEIGKILQSAQVKEKLASLGSEVRGGSSADFAKTIQADIVRYADVVKVSGMTPD
jgi:hypothetical protein